MLASLTSKKWGWKKTSMRKVYTIMQRSVIAAECSVMAALARLSKSQFRKLEKTQNSSLRIMSGQYASTPLEALETAIESYETTRLLARD